MSTMQSLTPREIVAELDKYIIGQDKAKRAMAIALRNRWRRQRVPEPMRDEIAPKNILMIGPTGVGKTEIARRLAKLTNAPFIKVEATKFTEVGYVGKDVESMIRELVDLSVKMIREDEQIKVMQKASDLAQERLLDLLIPKKKKAPKKKAEAAEPDTPELGLELVKGLLFPESGSEAGSDTSHEAASETQEVVEEDKTREKFRAMLLAGKLDKRMVEIDVNPGRGMPTIEVVTAGGLEDIGSNIRDMLSQFMPRGNKVRKVSVADARDLLTQEEAQRLVDMEQVVQMAIDNVEQNGIVFLDEMDKICSRDEAHRGGEVSREGVQRDLLPVVEGSNVGTKYGMVRTDHILFVAAGAFHISKPSDLIPELQGRFPIRVELEPLTENDFLRILTEPENSLTKQYMALMQTEAIALTIEAPALAEIARFSAQINQQTENIGARRLHTVLERVLDAISFDAPDRSDKTFVVTADYVREQLSAIVADQDLTRYIL